MLPTVGTPLSHHTEKQVYSYSILKTGLVAQDIKLRYIFHVLDLQTIIIYTVSAFI